MTQNIAENGSFRCAVCGDHFEDRGAALQCCSDVDLSSRERAGLFSESTHDRQCRRCGTVVTQRFIDVFGKDGNLFACIECSTKGALQNGVGADPDRQRRTHEIPLSEARMWRGDSPRAAGGDH